MTKFIAVIALFFLNVGAAVAQNTGTGGNTGTGFNTGTGDAGIRLDNPLGTDNFQTLVWNIYVWLFTLSIPICTIMVIVGGYQIMIAAGDEEKLKTGRRTITYAAVGFAVVLLAGGVVSLIRELTGA